MRAFIVTLPIRDQSDGSPHLGEHAKRCQHPRQTLSMMARAFRSAQGTASGTGARNARGGVRPRWRMIWARLRGARTALRLRRGIRTSRSSGLIGPIRTPGVLGLDSPTGAKVEAVALGLRAFKVVIAEGAALGLWALGLMADAAALGLTELGPVAAGAEPGIGIKTPWARAAPAQMRVNQAVEPTNQRLRVGGIAPSREPTFGTGLIDPRPATLGNGLRASA